MSRKMEHPVSFNSDNSIHSVSNHDLSNGGEVVSEKQLGKSSISPDASTNVSFFFNRINKLLRAGRRFEKRLGSLPGEGTDVAKLKMLLEKTSKDALKTLKNIFSMLDYVDIKFDALQTTIHEKIEDFKIVVVSTLTYFLKP
ncbi:hypothetical protein RND71_014934 [Anisodus tanguticus]|uniref:Uncharacterized protein n=1 Tax=Anisodus tanguticus TaxID=243964 RepID=A0AAE1SCK0_9SOLA|nr:hypothetical protein RND71_014934 [Anisodus tanguticus]